MKIELSRYSNKAIDIQRPISGYIPNGNDNLFSNYLNGLFNNSPTHQSVIEDLVGYIIGQGLQVDNPQDEQRIKKFFDFDFLECLEKYRKIHSAVCILVTRDALYRISKLEVINPAQIRVSQLKDGEPCRFKYRKSWDKGVNYRRRDEYELDAYNKFSEHSLLYWYDSGVFDLPYGRPSYISGTDAIEFEIGLYMGDNHGAQNGLTPSAIITKPTSGDPEQDKEDDRAILNNLSGISNKGKAAIVNTKAGGEGNAPTVTLLNDNSTESKKTNYEVAEAGILKAWRIPSPTLISGLNIKPTGFGDAEAEMQWALDSLKEKFVEPNRKKLLDIFKPLFVDLELQSVPYFVEKSNAEDEEGEKAASRFSEFGVGGVTGILEIQSSIAEGRSSFEGGVATLQFVYGFDENSARRILGGDKSQEVVQESDNLKDEVNENIKNLTGRQQQNIDRIVRKFKRKKYTRKQAELMLKNGFAMTDEEVDAWLEKDSVELSKHLTLDDIINEADTHEDLADFEVYSVEDAKATADEELLSLTDAEINLAKTGTARPNSKSSQDGVKGDFQYKIRYEYVGNDNPQREFCQRMIKAKKLYRYEDIRNMSFANVNAGFGRNGANNYDIFSYKGGPNCKHKWQRITFVKKGLEGGIDTKSGTARDKSLSESQADRRGMTPKGTAKSKQRISETRPFDMPNRGYYKMAVQYLKDIING